MIEAMANCVDRLLPLKCRRMHSPLLTLISIGRRRLFAGLPAAIICRISANCMITLPAMRPRDGAVMAEIEACHRSISADLSAHNAASPKDDASRRDAGDALSRRAEA